MALLNEGKGKDRIFEQTGQTVGVNDVNFNVAEGEIFVVMGLSGFGKSTLVRMINGLIKPSAGEILTDGVNVTSSSPDELSGYGLRDHVNPIKASYAASMADAVAAHQQGTPILFYTWTSNWTVNTLKPGTDVMWIEVPKVDLPEDQKNLEAAATRPGVPGCVEDPCKLGFPANDIRPVANSAFLKDNPAAKALLEEVSIPIEDIFAQNAKMNDGEGKTEDIQRHASEWIETHGDLVSEWVEKAKTAAN
ncbi:glycine betaine ABC transporter substrate-binding protein [Mesorhizobium sp. A623]